MTECTAEEITQLTQALHRFFSHLDERRYEDLAALFLPEARWLRQGQWLEGRQAILGAMAARPASVRVRHIISNILVTRRCGSDAEVEAYLTAYRQREGERPTLFSINLVGNVFRRDAGAWRLAEQRLVREFEFEGA